MSNWTPDERRAAELLGLSRRPPDELLGDGDDIGSMSVKDLVAAIVQERERCARVLSREADERGPLLQDDVTEILGEILLPDWPTTDEEIDRIEDMIREVN